MPEIESRYYIEKGRAHDMLLRCKDCKRLVTHEALCRNGQCPKCGNRRVSEIISLSMWEWLRIRCGLLQFKDRRLFLKEFSRARG